MEMNAGILMTQPMVTGIMKMLVNVEEHGVDKDIIKIKGVMVDEEDGEVVANEVAEGGRFINRCEISFI